MKQYLKSMALAGALLLVPFTAHAEDVLVEKVAPTKVVTLGVTGGGDDIDDDLGFTVTYEFGKSLQETNLYGSFTYIDAQDIDLDITSFVVGGSFATGSAFKPRFGLAYNEANGGGFDYSEVGADIGFLWLTDSWLVVTGGYNTALDTTTVGLGVQW